MIASSSSCILAFRARISLSLSSMSDCLCVEVASLFTGLESSSLTSSLSCVFILTSSFVKTSSGSSSSWAVLSTTKNCVLLYVKIVGCSRAQLQNSSKDIEPPPSLSIILNNSSARDFVILSSKALRFLTNSSKVSLLFRSSSILSKALKRSVIYSKYLRKYGNSFLVMRPSDLLSPMASAFMYALFVICLVTPLKISSPFIIISRN